MSRPFGHDKTHEPGVTIPAARAWIWMVAMMVLPLAAAATTQMSRSVLGNGGGTGTGGGRTLRATAGQAAIGASTNGTFKLCSGFWCFGGTSLVSVDPPPGETGPVSHEFSFSPPTPNPAQGRTRFRITLPSPSTVSLEVYDVAGRVIGEPQTLTLGAGEHELWWTAAREQAGVYFARLRVEGEVRAERRFILVR
jgi:hypothetical protein